MSEPKLPSWMNYSDYEDIMHYLRLFGEMKPYYLKAEDVFNAEQEVMKRKIDDGLRLIDVAKEMIWSYKYKERWHQLPKDENMNLESAKKLLLENGYILEDKYMDDMDDELDNIDTVNKFNEFFKDVASTVEDKFGVKLKPAKVPYFKFGNELEGNKKFVSAEIGENQYIFVVGFYNGEGRKTTAFGKEIDNPWFKHIEVCVGGYVHKKDKDILVGATGIDKDYSNLDEAINFYKDKLPKTANGFFKKIGNKINKFVDSFDI